MYMYPLFNATFLLCPPLDCVVKYKRLVGHPRLWNVEVVLKVKGTHELHAHSIVGGWRSNDDAMQGTTWAL